MLIFQKFCKFIIIEKQYNKNIDIQLYSFIKKYFNIFSTTDWEKEDYGYNIENDVALQAVKPLGMA